MLQDAEINDMEGVQERFKEMVSTVLENGLEEELEDELSPVTIKMSRCNTLPAGK